VRKSATSASVPAPVTPPNTPAEMGAEMAAAMRPVVAPPIQTGKSRALSPLRAQVQTRYPTTDARTIAAISPSGSGRASAVRLAPPRKLSGVPSALTPVTPEK